MKVLPWRPIAFTFATLITDIRFLKWPSAAKGTMLAFATSSFA
jgi:hypothetical protein